VNPWDDTTPPPADLPAFVAWSRECGARAEPSVCVPAACATFLAIAPRGVAVPLISGATTEVGVRARRDGRVWVLAGDMGAVPFGGEATSLLVAARTISSGPSPDALGLFVVDPTQPGVVRTPRTQLGTRSTVTVRLDDLRVGADARYDDGERATWASVVVALDKATVVAAAELTSIARTALSRAVAYASTREQFGAPIATYQALAHRLVDMAIDTEAAELAVEEAALDPTPANVSRAKIVANDAAQRVTAGLHQINGGVGFYADQAPPGLFARALALRVEMGDSRTHRLRLAGHLAYPATIA
jgi:alkylation response protein AidB-like acyl-CoA dehydrogenase